VEEPEPELKIVQPSAFVEKLLLIWAEEVIPKSRDCKRRIEAMAFFIGRNYDYLVVEGNKL